MSRFGNTVSLEGSPLPQTAAATGPAAVRVVHGFLQNLPARGQLFFARQFFTGYPRPIQVSPVGGTPFPRTIQLMRLSAPVNQSIVIRGVSFKAFQHSGIGSEDVAEIPYGRSVGVMGFTVKFDNQSMLDFQTNLPDGSGPLNFNSPSQGVGSSLANAPREGQGQVKQGVGSVTPNFVNDPFASYVRQGAPMTAAVTVLRPPPFDLRFFSVEVSGWLMESVRLESLLGLLGK